MPKLTEEDLKELFKKPEPKPEEKPPEAPGVKIGMKFKKSRNIENTELKVRKIKKHIRKLKEPKKRQRHDSIRLFKFTFWAGLAGFIFFIIINSTSYADQIKWAYFVDYLNQSFPASASTPTPAPTPTPTQTPSTIAFPLTLPSVSQADGNYIKIDKISINAPVIWNVAENNIINELKNGVVHYEGTSLPGEGGNVFLTGHSSNYIWIKSDYNHIFSLLDKLENGDRIEIRKESKSYFYTVKDKKVVSPNDVSILKNTNKEILTLMTCWPVGTSLNRLIVQSELLYSSS